MNTALLEAKIPLMMKVSTESRAERQRFFAIVDSSRDPLLVPTLKAYASNCVCLYAGTAKEEFGDDAPWLIELKPDESTIGWLISEGFGKRWGCFVTSPADLGQMRLHLKKFIKVGTWQGDSFFFRFADPQTIATYLKIFSLEQRQQFFSLISTVGFEFGNHAFTATELDGAGNLIWAMVRHNEDGDTLQESQGVIKVPPEDIVSGSSARPLIVFSQPQVELPIIMNGALLIDELIDYLDDDFGSRMNAYPKGLLRMMIDHATHLAIKVYVIQDLAHIKLFVGLMWRIAPGFHREPELNRVLSQTSLPAQQRFDRILGPSYSDAWARSTRFDSPSEWHPFGSDELSLSK